MKFLRFVFLSLALLSIGGRTPTGRRSVKDWTGSFDEFGECNEVGSHGCDARSSQWRFHLGRGPS